MREHKRNAIFLASLFGVALFSWVTGEGWLLAAAVGGALAGSLVGPVRRYYRTGSVGRKRLLIASNQLVTVLLLALLARTALRLGGADAPPAAWLPWLPVVALPVALFAWGFVLWRRVEAEARGA